MKKCEEKSNFFIVTLWPFAVLIYNTTAVFMYRDRDGLEFYERSRSCGKLGEGRENLVFASSCTKWILQRRE